MRTCSSLCTLTCFASHVSARTTGEESEGCGRECKMYVCDLNMSKGRRRGDWREGGGGCKRRRIRSGCGRERSGALQALTMESSAYSGA